MNQSLFVVPSEDWQRKIRQRLELLEGHRLGTREEVLAAFMRNRDTFQPDARNTQLYRRLYAEAYSRLRADTAPALQRIFDIVG